MDQASSAPSCGLRFKKSGGGIEPVPGDLFFAGIARGAFGGIAQALGGGNPHQHRLLVDQFSIQTGSFADSSDVQKQTGETTISPVKNENFYKVQLAKMTITRVNFK